ncbi:hypothetical protein CLOSTMETH_03338 [[Clostridium] methylpentosum DSM 5476]|uniref:Uncharacterized protein n=1 Tax=[Clostridium] methylpentosum DSM 5476 TaxID=537013 RepID=C0EHJ3_9FIRM|nr:hypothetical protein CLOSTMETH_03338 [[Clostridium] methylpentosum DSM 5476]
MYKLVNSPKASRIILHTGQMGKKQTNYPAASKTFSGCTECSSLHRQWAEFFKSIGHCALYNGFLSPSHRGN